MVLFVMNNQLVNFIKTNWSLYFILFIDVFIEHDNSMIIESLDNNNVYYNKIFSSLVFNFIYLLLPFYNVGLKIAQDSLSDTKINFTNMIKSQVILSSLLSIVCFYSKTYYYDKMKIVGFNYSIHLVLFVITTNSLLGCLNGYLTGKNDTSILLKFNIINLISNYLCNRIVLNYNLSGEEMIYTKNIPGFISNIYILYRCKSLFCYKYFFSSKFTLIKFGLQLMIRNLVTLFGVNINNYILFKLNKEEIKQYEVFSSKINNYLNIYGPLSTITPSFGSFTLV